MRRFNKRCAIGIDEAGRGPLAGPLTVACVIIPKKYSVSVFKGIRDSKRLTALGREKWFAKFKSDKKICFSATSVGPAIIDRMGISKATSKSITRLIKRMDSKIYSRILLDGGLKAPAGYLQKTIIGGDRKIPAIAAASIVAKITRDRKMERLHKKLPVYRFDLHKGYGTEIHYKNLKKHGLSLFHRKTYLKKVIGNVRV